MHWFLDPIQNHYVDFEGRVSRKAYWMFVLCYIIVAVVVGIVGGILGTEFLSGLLSLALLLPSLGMGVRRLHDINKSGWWLLISLIPLIGSIVLIIFAAQKGDAGENKYGPNPNGASTANGVAATPASENKEPAQAVAPDTESNNQQM